MLLIRPCPFHSLHVVVRIQNIFLITFLPAKDTKFHHQTLMPLTSQFTKRYYVLASHSSNGSCHTQPQPAQPALGGRCVCREAGGVRNGGAWSSGMLGQALQAFDTAYWDHTRFLPMWHQTSPEIKASMSPGFSAQTEPSKWNRYTLKM